MPKLGGPKAEYAGRLAAEDESIVVETPPAGLDKSRTVDRDNLIRRRAAGEKIDLFEPPVGGQ